MASSNQSGFLRWLGRQVGYVRTAIHTDPSKSNDPNPGPVFERKHVEESPHPDDPRLKLRRTTIDEVLVDPDVESRRDPK